MPSPCRRGDFEPLMPFGTERTEPPAPAPYVERVTNRGTSRRDDTREPNVVRASNLSRCSVPSADTACGRFLASFSFLLVSSTTVSPTRVAFMFLFVCDICVVRYLPEKQYDPHPILRQASRSTILLVEPSDPLDPNTIILRDLFVLFILDHVRHAKINHPILLQLPL